MKRFISLLLFGFLAISGLSVKAQVIHPGVDMYLDPNGTNNPYCSLTFPCATPGYAIKQLGKFWTLGQSLTIHFNPGDYNCPGALSGTLVGNLGPSDSGIYVIFEGAPLDSGGNPTTFLQNPTSGYCIQLSNAAGVLLQNLSIDTGTSSNGISCQAFSLCQIDHVAFVGTGYAIHTESSGYTEANGDNNDIIINGNLAGFWTGGDGSGYLAFDPGGTGMITCGTGFTAIGQQFFYGDQGAHVLIGVGWSTSGCGSVTGTQFILTRNSVLTNCGNTACSTVAIVIPGSTGADYRLLSQGAQIYPVTLPTVNTTTGIGNGTVAVVSGSGPHGGIAAITAGSTTTATGSVSLAFGEINTMNTNKASYQCSLEDTSTGTWLTTAYPCQIGYTGEASVEMIFNNNGTVLTSGDVYNLTYSSNGDN